MDTIRHPAVAGQFYPAEADALRASVQAYLDEGGEESPASHPAPKALIAPHAGYIYSGGVAGRAYATLTPERAAQIKRVVLIGPAHRVGFYGIAAPSVDGFQTSLGTVPVDQDSIEKAVKSPTVFRFDDPHRNEHSLEVQLPFLQMLLDDFTLVPLVVGSATGEEVASALEDVWGGDDTLVVISSDLSHYLDYDTAREVDTRTSNAIRQLKAEEIQPGHACGYVPVQGLLINARRHGLRGETLDLRSSGDTAGPREQVVGYGAYAFS
ncbi:MAG: AmmeMemoRadiSam system protein B [Chromatiaceae bacterium]|nr:MAG: AmmeMemoRadiSam system protein B [Chromatiaceae bacterium]